jgi:putative ABC transport system permease protein
VTEAAIGTSIPFGNDGFGMGFGIDGRPGSNNNPTIADVGVAVTPGYLSTLGIPLVEGRAFDDTDRTDSLQVVLVSQSLARAYWGDASPIGARIQLPERPNLRTVIGVVGDAKWGDLSGPDPRVLYLPLSQHNAFSPTVRRVVVRTDADPVLIAGNLRTIVGSLDADTPVSDIRTSSARISGSIARPRFAAYLLAGFAGVALSLAAIGIYGTLSYAMNRRIPEIGVRLALGASDRDVFGLLFRHGLRLTLIGIGIGIPCAVGATQLLTSLLFGVDPADPGLLAVVAVSLLAIGLAVSYLPARRAGRVDPIVALRHQ